MRRAAAVVLAGAALGALLPSCASDPRAGYSFSGTLPEGVATVRIPVFENYTYETGLDAELTEALIKEVQRSTGLRVVQGEGADTVLAGVITSMNLRRLSLDRQTGFAQELAVTITADFEWKDARSGKVLVARRNYASTDTFVASRPTSERLETGRHGAVQRLAKDIASELRSGW
jgi:hypothetical protein